MRGPHIGRSSAEVQCTKIRISSSKSLNRSWGGIPSRYPEVVLRSLRCHDEVALGCFVESVSTVAQLVDVARKCPCTEILNNPETPMFTRRYQGIPFESMSARSLFRCDQLLAILQNECKINELSQRHESPQEFERIRIPSRCTSPE